MDKESKKKIVFVVEDDELLVKAYQLKLEKEGLEVWVATDGREALSFLEKNPPNLVLLDLLLPGVGGFDVLAEIRKRPLWKDVPVIIMTNLGQEQDIMRGKDLGATDYIVKANLRMNEIYEKVKQYLE